MLAGGLNIKCSVSTNGKFFQDIICAVILVKTILSSMPDSQFQQHPRLQSSMFHPDPVQWMKKILKGNWSVTCHHSGRTGFLETTGASCLSITLSNPRYKVTKSNRLHIFYVDHKVRTCHLSVNNFNVLNNYNSFYSFCKNNDLTNYWWIPKTKLLVKGSFINNITQRGGRGVSLFVAQVHKAYGIGL